MSEQGSSKTSSALVVPQADVKISMTTGGLDFSAGLGFLGLTSEDDSGSACSVATALQAVPPRRQRKKKEKVKPESQKTKQDKLIEERQNYFDDYIKRNPAHIIEIANDCEDSIGTESFQLRCA